jgi:small subunit ribosomal protein S2
METQSHNTSLIERLFKAGAHFGFTRSRRHPTVTPFIFGNKQGTDIIDLDKSSGQLTEAAGLLREAGKAGKTILFVGTKEEISQIVKHQAEAAGVPFVVNRWIGGMLTNFSEIRKRIARMNELLTQGESGELERKYTKKERVIIGREMEKLNFNFAGIKSIERAPHYMVVVDPRHDEIAVKEAHTLHIPVIGIMSSDSNLSEVTHPIVVNDALQSSVTLVLSELIAAYEEGKSAFVPQKREERAPRAE